MAESHEYSKKILKDYVALHGETLHKISKTSIKIELRAYEKLNQLLGLWLEYENYLQTPSAQLRP